MPDTTVHLDAAPPSIAQFVAIAREGAKLSLGPVLRARVAQSRRLVERFLFENRLVYGVTTGFGDNVRHIIAPDDSERLQHNIVRSHSTSVGEPLDRETVRAIMLMMIVSLGKGYSGVRPDLLDRIVALLNADVVPFAPGEGSVGYLAIEGHIALVLIGEGRARVGDGPWLPGARALGQVGLEPLPLVCKEGLALLNGTTSVTAHAVLALHNAMQAAAALDVAAALSFEVLRGTTRALDLRLHAAKAHPEQARIAAYLFDLLADSALARSNRDYRLQDFYALRAAPQLHGAAASFIAHARKSIEAELASSGDNPVIVATEDEDGIAISGGNFDGSYVGLACDSLVTAMTMLAKVSERRSDRMVNSHFSELPAFLVREPGLNSGYMIVQYTAAGLVGEMRSLSMPASVDTVPTCGNQEDPVSFAYNAAAKALRVSRKFEWVVAIEVMTACQGLDFRDIVQASSSTRAVHRLVRSVVGKADADRAFYPDMVSVATLVRSGAIRDAADTALNSRHRDVTDCGAEASLQKGT